MAEDHKGIPCPKCGGRSISVMTMDTKRIGIEKNPHVCLLCRNRFDPATAPTKEQPPQPPPPLRGWRLCQRSPGDYALVEVNEDGKLLSIGLQCKADSVDEARGKFVTALNHMIEGLPQSCIRFVQIMEEMEEDSIDGQVPV